MTPSIVHNVPLEIFATEMVKKNRYNFSTCKPLYLHRLFRDFPKRSLHLLAKVLSRVSFEISTEFLMSF